MRLVSRAREQRGMTLIEMLVALSIGMIVCLAVFSLVDFTMRRSGEISGRVNANQRGRLAMDIITRQLRSQVCQPSGTPPMFSRAGNTTDANNATFFVDLTDDSNATAAPELHTISYDAGNHQIVERDYTATKPADPTVDPTYSSTPVRTRTLLSDVTQNGSTPIFSYLVFNGATPLPVPVTGDALGSIATIQIAYKALPARFDPNNPNPRGSAVFQDRVSVREVDPNATDPEPECE